MMLIRSEDCSKLVFTNINLLFMAYKVLGLLLTHYIGCCRQCKMMWFAGPVGRFTAPIAEAADF